MNFQRRERPIYRSEFGGQSLKRTLGALVAVSFAPNIGSTAQLPRPSFVRALDACMSTSKSQARSHPSVGRGAALGTCISNREARRERAGIQCNFC